MQSFSYDKLQNDIEKSSTAVEQLLDGEEPKTAVILGSGLGEVADNYPVLSQIDYLDLPALPSTQVSGHKGVLKIAKLNDKAALFFCGRSHLYEGHVSQHLGNAVRISHSVGVETIISTCAVGSLKSEIPPGSVVVVEDHINYSGVNPLIGVSIANQSTTFHDLSSIYDSELRNRAMKAGHPPELSLKEGIYAWVSGPTYETPAESRMLNILGADVVGMSLLPESIVACQLGMKVLALACVTNYAPGLDHESADHARVLEQAKLFAPAISHLIENVKFR